MIHSHASKMVLAIGWSCISTVENDPQCPSLWASPGAPWTSLHNDVWMPRRRVPSGKCITFLHPFLGSHTVSSSLTSVGSGSHKDPHSFKWRESTLHILRGSGRVIEVLWVERYCWIHLCKIQFAPLTSSLKTLSRSIYFCHCSHKEIWSCHSLVGQQGRLFSALHHTRSGLFCRAASLHGIRGHLIPHWGVLKLLLLWPKLRKG